MPIFRPAPQQATLALYVVQPGDSLLDIAGRHGADLESLIALNSIEYLDMIMAGASLRVPTTTASQVAGRPDEHP